MWVHVHPSLAAFIGMCSGFFFFWLIAKSYHDRITPVGVMLRTACMAFVTCFMVAMVIVMIFRLRFI